MNSQPERSENGRAHAGSWLARHPTLTTVAAAAGFFSLLQAGFVLLREQDFDRLAALGLAKFGLIVGFVTALLLVPIALVARRWHPAWKRGDRAGATRSLLFGLIAVVGSWMIVDSWLAGGILPAAIVPWIGWPVAVGIGILVARRPPSERLTRRAALPLLFLAILLVFVPGPDYETAEEAATPLPDQEAAASEASPDIVLVSIDTLRRDRLGAFGASPSLTPEMDRVAGEGFVFERALAASPWTVPSVASMLTGLPTARHGSGLPLSSGPTFRRSPLSADAVTLSERLAAAGYRTRAVVANGFLSPEMGFARGFDLFLMPARQATGVLFLTDMPLARLLLALFPVEEWGDFRAQGITDQALEILEEEGEAPLFLWIHYIDPHTPFQADPSELDLDAWRVEMRQVQPEVLDDGTVVGEVFAGTSHVRGGMLWLSPEDRLRIEEYYDRAVTYVDEQVGRLFAALRERQGERPVVAVLTSDHGEEFWEHGYFEHGHDYYSEVTHIPLAFWGPGVVPRGRTAAGPVGLVDVPSTLLDLAGLEAPTPEAPDEGRSLAPWLTARSAEGSAEGQDGVEDTRIRFSEGNLYGIPAVLLEDEDWRFILRANGVVELYDVARDPHDRDNRAPEHPELVERYRDLVEPRLAVFLETRAGDAAALDPQTRKALQALGYAQ